MLGPTNLRSNSLSWLPRNAIVLAMFVLGLWLIVLRPMGPNFDSVPGTLSDGRFNNYVLEHFVRWLWGLDKDYWSVGIFYPYRWATAFSDNLLGAAPAYALLRMFGYDGPSAFQRWYVLSFFCNYGAAAFVLSKSGRGPLAIGAGAFLFAFGLPALAQEIHVQMAYRFCVPLASFFMWRFHQEPQLKSLAALALVVVWQFYFSIYTGVLLCLLLLALLLAFPFVNLPLSRGFLLHLNSRLISAWVRTPARGRAVYLTMISLSLILFAELLIPYYTAYRTYGFQRTPQQIGMYLPRPESYLVSDNSQVWSFLGRLFPNLPQRQEQQLFPGSAPLILFIIGLSAKLPARAGRRLVQLHLVAALALFLITLEVAGYSVYQLLGSVPGLDSLRAVGRLLLVLMWPMALHSAWVLDGLWSITGSRSTLVRVALGGIVGALFLECTLYSHVTFSKADAALRISVLHAQIPPSVPQSPILFLTGAVPAGQMKIRDMDAMILAQQLGWPTLNGYSSNHPPGYQRAVTCLAPVDASNRIRSYMEFMRVSDRGFLSQMLDRVVMVGPSECGQ